VKTGVQAIYKSIKMLDSGFRRNDGNPQIQAFKETIKKNEIDYMPVATNVTENILP
jgi:hypothetical protein